MAIAIEQLVQDLTPEDVLEDLLAIAKAVGLPVNSWKSGEPIHALLTILSEYFARYWNSYIVKAIRAGFLDYAEGTWLTLLALVTYGVLRNKATFAARPLKLENRAGGVWPIAPGDIRLKNVNGKTFVNTSSGALAAFTGTGGYPTVTLDFQADEAGSESNTAPGEIEAYPLTPVTAPEGVYAITNAEPIYADDEEDDDLLKERCRLAAAVLSPAGARKAYEYVARSAKRADGTSVDVTRVKLDEPGDCIVNVYLAGLNGSTTGDTSTIGSDVYIANQEIQLKVVPAGITANVAAATELAIVDTVTIYIDRGSIVTEAEAKAAAKSAITKYFQKLPIGGHRISEGGVGKVIGTAYAAEAKKSIDGIIKAVAAAGDVTLASNQVAVPIITVVALTVTQ